MLAAPLHSAHNAPASVQWCTNTFSCRQQAWSGSVREKYPFEGPEAPRIREKYQAGLQAAVSYSQNTVLAAQNTE